MIQSLVGREAEIAIFKDATGTKKQVFFTLLTPFPIVPNEHSLAVSDRVLDMDCLFKAV